MFSSPSSSATSRGEAPAAAAAGAVTSASTPTRAARPSTADATSTPASSLAAQQQQRQEVLSSHHSSQSVSTHTGATGGGGGGGGGFSLSRQLSGSGSSNGIGVMGRMFRRASQSGHHGVNSNSNNNSNNNNNNNGNPPRPGSSRGLRDGTAGSFLFPSPSSTNNASGGNSGSGGGGGGGSSPTGGGGFRITSAAALVAAASFASGAGLHAHAHSHAHAHHAHQSHHGQQAVAPPARSTSFDNVRNSAVLPASASSNNGMSPSTSSQGQGNAGAGNNPSGSGAGADSKGGNTSGRPSFFRSASNQIANRVRKLSQNNSFGGLPISSSSSNVSPFAGGNVNAASGSTSNLNEAGGISRSSTSMDIGARAASGLRAALGVGGGSAANGNGGGNNNRRRSVDAHTSLSTAAGAAGDSSQNLGVNNGSGADVSGSSSAANLSTSGVSSSSIPAIVGGADGSGAGPSSGSAPSASATSTKHRIRLVPHLEATRSLHFEPIERDVKEGNPPIKIGRFTDRHTPPAPAPAPAPALAPLPSPAGLQGGAAAAMETSEDVVAPAAEGDDGAQETDASNSNAQGTNNDAGPGGVGATLTPGQQAAPSASGGASSFLRAPGVPGARGGAIPSSAGGGGRVDTARVAFKSKVVSRSHAELWCEPGGNFFIRDTKSSSGTFLNHIRLSGPNSESKPFPLKDGDVIQLGVDYQGGTEEIYRCVKMRVELNRGWQRSATQYNVNALRQLRALQGTPLPSGSAEPSTPATATAPGAPAVASALPTNAQAVSVTDCCICLFSVTVCQSLFIAPCSHVFHYKCIRPLLMRHHPGFSCPLCRTFADLEADVEEDEAWQQALLQEAMAGTNPNQVHTPMIEAEQPPLAMSPAPVMPQGEDGQRPALTVATGATGGDNGEEQQEMLASASPGGAASHGIDEVLGRGEEAQGGGDSEMEDGTTSSQAQPIEINSSAQAAAIAAPAAAGETSANVTSAEEATTPQNQHFLSTLAESGSIGRGLGASFGSIAPSPTLVNTASAGMSGNHTGSNVPFVRSPLMHEIIESRRESEASQVDSVRRSSQASDYASIPSAAHGHTNSHSLSSGQHGDLQQTSQLPRLQEEPQPADIIRALGHLDVENAATNQNGSSSGHTSNPRSSSGSGLSPPPTANHNDEPEEMMLAAASGSTSNVNGVGSSAVEGNEGKDTDAASERTPRGKSAILDINGNSSNTRPRSVSSSRSWMGRMSGDAEGSMSSSPSKLGRLWRKASGNTRE